MNVKNLNCNDNYWDMIKLGADSALTRVTVSVDILWTTIASYKEQSQLK